jgi:hypothetical protein
MYEAERCKYSLQQKGFILNTHKDTDENLCVYNRQEY